MRIRWKLLIVLLAFSLIPMATVFTVSQQSARSTGKEIAGGTRDELTSIVSRELAQTAEYHARTIRRNRSNLELALNVLVHDAEESLGRDSYFKGSVYYAEDFTTPGFAPDDLAPSMRYPKKNADGIYEASKVSFRYPVIYTAPGVSRAEIAPQARELAGLFRRFGRLAKKEKRLHLDRAYVSLARGAHVSWPGHGGYPEGFDPRTRPWYKHALKKDGIVWSAPIRDTSTGRLMFTASEAFRDSKGDIAGVAALDVPLVGFLQVRDLVSQWSMAMQAFLVYAGDNRQVGKKGLWIVARQRFENGRPEWSGGDLSRRLESSDASGLSALVGDMMEEKAGYSVLPYEGTPSIWAHASVADDTSLVIIVPMRVVDKLPDQAAGTIMGLVHHEARVAGGTGLAVFVVVLLAAFFGSRAITRPLGRMSEAAGTLAAGNFNVRISERFNDERDELVSSFNEMVPRLEEHVRMRDSLELASEIQQNLLPKHPPAMPGLDVAGRSVPCDETGGDYYDYIENTGPDKTRLGLVVGDVTGHGVPAALLMATARAVIRGMGHGLNGSDPRTSFDLGRRVERLNALLTMDLSDTSRFMTLLWMEIDPGKRTAAWVRAGHDPALIYDPAQDRFDELWGDSGLVLGVDADMDYQESSVELPPGAVILAGTDGIWEAVDKDEQMYGKERLMDVIRNNARFSAEDIVGAVLDSVNAFRGDAPITDDITLVAVKLA